MVTEAELLAAVFADPEVDAPRLVYADWLQERGDPRGAFIAAQCAHGRAEAAPLEHEAAWLGELAELLDPEWRRTRTRFQRGFLSHACLRRDLSAPRHRALAQHPAWSTLVAVDGDVRAILRPGLTALRRVGWGLDPEDFSAICALPYALGIERVHVAPGWTPALELAVARAEAPVFQRLRSIDLRFEQDRCAWFLESRLSDRVREVVAWRPKGRVGELPLSEWMEAMLAHENLEDVHFSGPSLHRRGEERVLRIPIDVGEDWHDALGVVPDALARAFAIEPFAADPPRWQRAAALLAERHPAFHHRPLTQSGPSEPVRRDD